MDAIVPSKRFLSKGLPGAVSSCLAFFMIWMPGLLAADMPLVDFSKDDALAGVGASLQKDASLKVVENNGSRGLEFTCHSRDGAWPGISIKSAGGIWNLSQYGFIEAKVTNLGCDPVSVCMKVDDSAGLISNPSNTAYLKIKAGESGILRVYLNFSRNGENYKLVPSKIRQVLIFTSSPKEDLRLRLDSLLATGKPGDAPSDYVPRIRPNDGVLVAVTGNLSSDMDIQQKGAVSKIETSCGDTIFSLEVPANAKGEMPGIVIRPKGAMWNLTAYAQVEFKLSNPGIKPVKVVCQLNNPEWAKGAASSEPTEIAPNSHASVIVPFIIDKIWDGTEKTQEQMRTSDAASEKAVGGTASDGQQLLSDCVAGASICIKNTNEEQKIIVEGVNASQAKPSILPEWSGKRPPVPGDWFLTLNENFDGSSLNPEIWTPRMFWTGYIPTELQRYTEKNVTVEGGFLHIRSEKLHGYLYDDPKLGLPTREYASGVLTTYDKWSQRYGYFEARMKIPSAPGLWPAFWTMPDRGRALGDKDKFKNQRTNTDVDGMEFDIMEHLSRLGPYRFNIACHWDGYGKEHKKIGTGRIYVAPDKDGFITAGMLWEPGKVTWYYNGNPVGTWTSKRVSSVPEFIILITQMGGWEGFDIDDSMLPAEFIVDYVRVWQRHDIQGPKE